MNIRAFLTCILKKGNMIFVVTINLFKLRLGGLILKKSEKISLVYGMVFGAIMFSLLYNSKFFPLFFWTLTVISAFIGYRFGSKGSRGKSLGYTSYGIAFLTLIYGFLLD